MLTSFKQHSLGHYHAELVLPRCIEALTIVVIHNENTYIYYIYLGYERTAYNALSWTMLADLLLSVTAIF